MPACTCPFVTRGDGLIEAADRPIIIDKRLSSWMYLLFGTLILLAVALFQFQVLHGSDYVRLATENRLRVIRLTPQRTIYDANQIPLAVSLRTFRSKVIRSPFKG